MIPQDQPHGRFKIFTLEEMLRPRPPLQWTVEGFLSPGSLSVFVGDSGCGKTYFMLYMAGCASLGIPFLGRPTRMCRVLLVDEESGEDRLARRLSGVVRGIGESSGVIDSLCLAQFDLRAAADVFALTKMIADGNYGLVIVDALADVMPGGDENMVKDTQPLMINLRKIAAEQNTAVGLIHHSGKSGVYRGSSAIKAACDRMFIVKKDEAVLKIDSAKMRDGEPFNLSAKMNFGEDSFWLSAVEDEKPLLGRAPAYVMGYLEEHGPSTRKAIIGAADICSERSALDGIYNLVKAGLIYRTNPAEVGRGSEAIYAIKQGVQQP